MVRVGVNIVKIRPGWWWSYGKIFPQYYAIAISVPVNHGKTIDGGALTTPPSMASSRQPQMKSEQNFYTKFCINYSRHMTVQPHPLSWSRHVTYSITTLKQAIDILTVDISLVFWNLTDYIHNHWKAVPPQQNNDKSLQMYENQLNVQKTILDHYMLCLHHNTCVSWWDEYLCIHSQAVDSVLAVVAVKSQDLRHPCPPLRPPGCMCVRVCVCVCMCVCACVCVCVCTCGWVHMCVCRTVCQIETWFVSIHSLKAGLPNLKLWIRSSSPHKHL